MKKFLALTFILISIIIPCKVNALDITAGITTWYAWVTQDYYNEPTEYTYYGDSYPYPYSYSPMKSDPGLLYGPAISVKFNDDFNLTFVYLYGQFNYKGKEYFYDDELSEVKEISKNFKSKRSDADLALNYRLNDFFKVFGGIKYLAFDMMDAKYEYQSPTDEYNYPIIYLPIMKNHGKHRSIGPGLGLSLTYPIIHNLFLLSNLSGFYLFDTGSEKVGLYQQKPIEGGGDYTPIYVLAGSFKASYREYGFNATLSLAYYIESISTSISLGGRWQYFITDYQDEIYDVSIKNSIYGITLSATYSFSFDTSKPFRPFKTTPDEEMLPILQDEPNMPIEKIGPRELIEQYRKPDPDQIEQNEPDVPNKPRSGGQGGEMLMPVD